MVFDDRVYAALVDTLLAFVCGLPDDVRSALLLCHNPGVVVRAQHKHAGAELEMNTSAIAVVEFDGSWTDIAFGRANMTDHTTPRGH